MRRKQVKLSPHFAKRQDKGLPTSLGDAEGDWAGEPIGLLSDTPDVEEVSALEFTTRLAPMERSHDFTLQLEGWEGLLRLIMTWTGAVYSPSHVFGSGVSLSELNHREPASSLLPLEH